MKRYYLPIGLSTLQLFMFYIFPLFAGPTDAMGMVFLILTATLLLAIVMGILSGSRLKFVWPSAVAVAFLPSVFIYYNESALIHAAWYFADALLGLCFGMLMRRLLRL